jgi:hypothetical protein
MSMAVRKAISFLRHPVLPYTSAWASQSEGAARFHHARRAKDPRACRRDEKIDFELCSENARVRRHQIERGVSGRAVGDGACLAKLDRTRSLC